MDPQFISESKCPLSEEWQMLPAQIEGINIG